MRRIRYQADRSAPPSRQDRDAAAPDAHGGRVVSAEPLPESDLVTGAARTSLASKLLHDLRSPLTQIVGYSEMLSEEADGQRREDFMSDVERIRSAGHRMLAIIEENFISGSEKTLVVVANEHDDVESAVNIQQDTATGLLLVV